MGIDLHVHSSASDGSFSPIEIIALAEELDLGAVAITDHDTVDGVRQALAGGIPDRLQFLTGLEISASRPPSFPGSGSFHLLGYGISPDDPTLNLTLEKLQTAREQRNPRIIERLNSMGMPIDLEDVTAQGDENTLLGRPHIAKALVEKGYVTSINDAFNRFLATDKPAYVDKYRVNCDNAIEIITGAGGVPVFAHPGLLDIRQPHVFEKLIRELTAMGLRGIEALYPEHSPDQTEQYLEAASRHGLLVTGGTDFHGTIKPEIQLGSGTGNFHVPYDIYEKLIATL